MAKTRLYYNEEELKKLKEAYPYHMVISMPDTDVDVFYDTEVHPKELEYYVRREYNLSKKYLKEMAFHFDGSHVDMSIGCDPKPDFERIRRITGYLVGTLDRFNDGKRAEEAARVKHQI